MSFALLALAVVFQQAPTAPPARVAPGVQDPKELFTKSKCVACHGEDGRGETEKGRKLKAPDFTSPKWSQETTDKEIRETIRNGVKDKKGKVLMPGYRTKLTARQINELGAYVRGFVRK